MVVALTIESDLKNSQDLAIVELSDLIENYFSDKEYGEDVLTILIGIMSLDTSNLGKFFKIRDPKYTDFKIIKDGIGNPVEIRKNLEWDVKPDYENLRNLNGIAIQAFIAKSIIESIRKIKLPKKIVNFDLRAFQQDFENFFKEKQLI